MLDNPREAGASLPHLMRASVLCVNQGWALSLIGETAVVRKLDETVGPPSQGAAQCLVDNLDTAGYG